MALLKEGHWHALEADEAIRLLKTGLDGLSEDEARRRLAECGPNELKREKRKSPFVMFLEQFKSILIWILIVATALSAVIGELIDAIVIVAIIIACAILGFVEEYRAEKALELLKKLAAPTTTVIREGKEKTIPTRELVPGDIVSLSVGCSVPADIRLLEAVNLRTNEAPLTGESTPVDKHAKPLPAETVLPDRANMAFSGTTVIYGRGKGVVVGTGMRTELGKIASMVQVVKEEATPLEKKMAEIGKWLGIACLSACMIVALSCLLRGYTLLEMLIWGIALAVAAVPEALPAVVTGSLAIGVREMAKRNAIVRRLPAVETLGCTSVICADKTGTMTKGEMTVRKVYGNGITLTVTGVGYEPKGEFYYEGELMDVKSDNMLQLLFKAAALCNDAKLDVEEGRWVVRGDTTEGALLVVSIKAGLTKEELDKYPRAGEVPFTSERKRMTTIHSSPSGLIAFMKGAPEVVLGCCKWIYKDGQIRELDEKDRAEILRVNELMANEALRNLAMAYRPLDVTLEKVDEGIENNFIFLGIAGMIDPAREEVKDSIELCKRAGIGTVMITGDHRLTAMAIARDLGMLKGSDIVLTGTELDQMSQEEYERIVENVRVYARVSPEHKVRIVEAWKKKGYVVSMTGDGINDAPALKMSDIGVSMGVTGTDVTKETSDMTLADDNFATIVAAVKEGRRIFDNIKKYLSYLLRCNLAEIGIAIAATSLGLPVPFTAAQILWINLATDGLPALALGVDPADPDVMDRPPRNPKETVFTWDVKIYLIILPLLTIALVIPIFAYKWMVTEDLTKAQTAVFLTIILCELFVALSCRSLRMPIYRVGILRNRFLPIAIAISFMATFCIFSVPQLHAAFDVTWPEPIDWAMGVSVASVLFATMEMMKLVMHKLPQARRAKRIYLTAPRLTEGP